MSPAFSGPLRIEMTGRTRKGRTVWRTLADLTLKCIVGDIGYRVTTPAGFETDLASVPRMFWRIAHPSGPYATSAVIHDWLYKNRIGTRVEADHIFLEGMKADGIGVVRRSLIFRAVRMFGNSGWGR